MYWAESVLWLSVGFTHSNANTGACCQQPQQHNARMHRTFRSPKQSTNSQRCTHDGAVVLAHLKLARVDAVVALNKRVAEVVDAELLQPFQRPIVKVEVVGVPAAQQGLGFRV